IYGAVDLEEWRNVRLDGVHEALHHVAGAGLPDDSDAHGVDPGVEDVLTVADGAHERPMEAVDAAVAAYVLSEPSPAIEFRFEIGAVEDASRIRHPLGVLARLVDEG